MKAFSEANKLLEQLQNKLNEIDELVNKKRIEVDTQLQQLKEELKDFDRMMSDKLELDDILINCSIDMCQYKHAFEEIRKTYSKQIHDHISNKKFHFFTCYRGDEYSYEKNVIDWHQEVIDKKDFCWWAKFYKERKPGGSYEDLEPFGESINVDQYSNVARDLKEKVKERLDNGECVYLFNYNPNPPKTKLYVSNVIDFYYGKGQIPYEDKDGSPPQCAYFPGYYFQSKKGNCISCKKIDPKRCKLRFSSNFYFKIDKIEEIKNVEEEFVNLINCFTDDSINFAVPIFYPLLISQEKDRMYFLEMVEPIPHKSGFDLNIPPGERSHTKSDKVKKFFEDLNKICCESFVGVASIDCVGPYSSKPKLQQTTNDDEILIYLPSEYRSDGRAIRFIITLDEKTSPEQKKKVLYLIDRYLDYRK